MDPIKINDKIKLYSLLAKPDIKRAKGSYFIRQYLPFTHPGISEVFDLCPVTIDEMLAQKDSGILVVQRLDLVNERAAVKLLDHCHNRGIPTVYEIDDFLFGLSTTHADYVFVMNSLPGARLFAKQADMIITSSDYLKNKLSGYNNVQCIPNALDERIWLPLQKRSKANNQDVKTRILYMGTYTHQNDLLIVAKAIKKLQREFKGKIEVDIIGVTKAQSQQEWFNTIQPPRTNYPKFVNWLRDQSNWSIGIAPLEDSKFNNCKSYIKYLDYAALGLAPVCSNLLPYQSVIRDGENGLLVDNDTDSWYRALKELIIRKEYREKIAQNAHQELIDHHTLESRVEKWKQLFRSLLCR